MARSKTPKDQYPRTWTEVELRRDVDRALSEFIKERMGEPNREYRTEFAESEKAVRGLLKATNNLLDPAAAIFQSRPEMVDAARFLGGPPVSADDLATLCGEKRIGPRIAKALACRVEEVLKQAWDPFRFPWLKKGRAPTLHELDVAVLWTAGVWAIEKVRTKRRLTGSRAQEKAVDEALSAGGLTKLVDHVGAVRGIDDISRGSFIPKEIFLAKTKCDRLARLRDGRLLAIECKVSNSAINSYKRLNHDTLAKAVKWQKVFGEQIMAVAVLSGVFKLQNVLDAQAAGVYIVWQHDFTPLKKFVQSVST